MGSSLGFVTSTFTISIRLSQIPDLTPSPEPDVNDVTLFVAKSIDFNEDLQKKLELLKNIPQINLTMRLLLNEITRMSIPLDIADMVRLKEIHARLIAIQA